jgi:enoyl-CoA hydratase
MKNISLEREDKIAVLTIANPPMNVLNTKLLLELKETLKKIESTKDLKALIITGSGEKAFVAGADIKELQAKSPEEALEFARLGQTTFSKLEKLSLFTIAAVRGYALGGGTELLLVCDYVIATETSKFGQPEIKLGIIPGFGGTQRLQRAIGENLAKYLILTGELIDAKEAFRIGLVNQLISEGDVLTAAKELARKVPDCKIALKLAKEAMRKAYLKEGFELEASLFKQCFSTKDAKEGLTAFLEKRAPRFQGE